MQNLVCIWTLFNLANTFTFIEQLWKFLFHKKKTCSLIWSRIVGLMAENATKLL